MFDKVLSKKDKMNLCFIEKKKTLQNGRIESKGAEKQTFRMI